MKVKTLLPRRAKPVVFFVVLIVLLPQLSGLVNGPMRVSAPVYEPEPWPDPVPIAEPAPPPPAIQHVTWRYKFRNGWGMTNVTDQIVDQAFRAWQDELGKAPLITGTTLGKEYAADPDHLEGCAVDFRIRQQTFDEAIAVSQRLAYYLLNEVDDQARVVLWWGSELHGNHVHAEIDNCGVHQVPEKGKAPWSFNQREMIDYPGWYPLKQAGHW